jgi:hypothetical protein
MHPAAAVLLGTIPLLLMIWALFNGKNVRSAIL